MKIGKEISAKRHQRNLSQLPLSPLWPFFEKIRGDAINPFAFSLLKKKGLWYEKPPKILSPSAK